MDTGWEMHPWSCSGTDSPPLGAAAENPSPDLLKIPPQSSQLFQPQPCVSVYLLCVPAEPRRPHTSCLHISCKFEFDLVGWSPRGLLDAFERVAGSERSAVRGDVWSRRAAERGSVGRGAGGERKEKEMKRMGIMAPSTQLTARTAPPSHILPQGMCGHLSIPIPQQHSLPRGETEPPQPRSDLLLCSPLQSGAVQSPSLSPHAPPTPGGPPALASSRLKHPAGGWERLAALPRRFSFIKHKAGGGFSQALGTAESLFSAASGRKMEGGQETGRPQPLFSF